MNRTRSLMLLAVAGAGLATAHPVMADPYGSDGSAQAYDTAAATDAAATATVPPPPLVAEAQPPIPGPGYLWTPGYWAFGPEGYYWVPGAWLLPPEVGYLWTPGYWGFLGGLYLFHAGYWGPTVGFYGGIDYGCGYDGFGYHGGYWNHGRFFYNRAVNNVSATRIHDSYYTQDANDRPLNRVSYNGGAGGVQARPTSEPAIADTRRFEATDAERRHIETRVAQPGSVAVSHPVAAPHAAGPRPASEDQRTEALNRVQIYRGGLGERNTAAPEALRDGVRGTMPARNPVERSFQPQIDQRRAEAQYVARAGEQRADEQRAQQERVQQERAVHARTAPEQHAPQVAQRPTPRSNEPVARQGQRRT